MKAMTVAIYGAGRYGESACRSLMGNCRVVAFIDSDPAKHGRKLCGRPVIHVEHFDFSSVERVYIASTGWREIRTLLKQRNVQHYRVWQLKRKKFSWPKAPLLRSCWRGDRVFVFQPGKVGSNSIVNGLKDCGIPAISFHTLEDSNICSQWDLKGQVYTPTPSWQAAINRAVGSRLLRRHGASNRYITGMREPVSRGLSLIFQALHFLVFDRNPIGDVDEESTEDLIHNLFADYYNHRYLLNWFDREFRVITGIDLLSHPFDRERGYTSIQTDLGKVFVYVSERLDEAEGAIGEFVGAPGFRFRQANRATAKWYAPLDKQIRSTFRLPEAWLRSLYAHPTVRHFYNDETIETWIRRWSGPTGKEA